MRTLLQLVQAACSELSLSRPTAVVSSADVQVQQLLAMMNHLGDDLVRDFEWQQLNKEHLFTTAATTLTGTTTASSAAITGLSSTTGLSSDYTVSAEGVPVWAQVDSVDSSSQVTLNQAATASGSTSITFSRTRYPLPSDYSKVLPQTEWDRTNHWPLMGPKSPQEWQFLKGGIVSQGPRMRFRILGNKFQLNPLPPADWSLAFEYMSSNWVIGADGTTKSQFTADDDTCAFSDSLMICGLKLRWLQGKGFEWGYADADYRRCLEAGTSQNKDAPVLSLSRSLGSIYISTNNLPETNFGQ